MPCLRRKLDQNIDNYISGEMKTRLFCVIISQSTYIKVSSQPEGQEVASFNAEEYFSQNNT